MELPGHVTQTLPLKHENNGPCFNESVKQNNNNNNNNNISHDKIKKRKRFLENNISDDEESPTKKTEICYLLMILYIVLIQLGVLGIV